MSKIINQGCDIIKSYCDNLTSHAGVYRMVAQNGQVLYVGKAKNLKKRVISYTKPMQLSVRIQRMVAQTCTMEFITTQTEVEALILEANLIKQLKPKYNILLRDDKSYPMLLIKDHEFPQIIKHRGAKSIKGQYFGPFASGLAVASTMQTLERLFKLRNCTDAVLNNRTRPCLQYHIKRCSAPCVGKITPSEYAESVHQAEQFLKGNSQELQQNLAEKMQEAAMSQNYEKAAIYRDQIQALTQIQHHQSFEIQGINNADIIGFHRLGAVSSLQIFYYRFGKNFGNRAILLPNSIDNNDDTNEIIMQNFLMQYYRDIEPPPLILLGQLSHEGELVSSALSQLWQKKITLRHPSRGEGVALIKQCNENAKIALTQHIANQEFHQKLCAELQEILNFPRVIKRIEIYDNSHNQGDKPVGAMVVANESGLNKKAYRLFNFTRDKTKAGADDFAMMREMLRRRFTRAINEGEGEETTHGFTPDVIMIDGGKGQLTQAITILKECGLYEKILPIGIAKGEDRNAGREIIHIPAFGNYDYREIALPLNHPVQFFIQRLRDEAHRFAIGAHRKLRSKAISANPINDIKGIGAKKKQALMLHFGSAEGVKDAGIQDLIKVNGISEAIAQEIYNFFH